MLAPTKVELAAIDAAAEIIARIKDPSLHDMYTVGVHRWLGMNDRLGTLAEEFVLDRVRRKTGGAKRAAPRGSNGPGKRAARSDQRVAADGQQIPGIRYDADDPVVNLERQALKLAIQRPALCGPVFDALPPDVFTVPVHRGVRDIISGCGGVAGAKSARDWAAQLIGAAPNDRAREFVTRLAVEAIETPRKDGEPDARYTEAVLARVEDLTLSRQINELKSRLQRLNPVERQDYNRTFGDLVALEQRHKALMGRASGAL